MNYDCENKVITNYDFDKKIKEIESMKALKKVSFLTLVIIVNIIAITVILFMVLPDAIEKQEENERRFISDHKTAITIGMLEQRDRDKANQVYF